MERRNPPKWNSTLVNSLTKGENWTSTEQVSAVPKLLAENRERIARVPPCPEIQGANSIASYIMHAGDVACALQLSPSR